jgi:diadenosine tetraphosphate (Ap4A) HIT family hydrolase
MSCIFCSIARGAIPCIKIAETAGALAFMDISPLSVGHCLVIPKQHAAKLHELSAADLAATTALLGSVSRAMHAAGDLNDYNILQNNGELAHQAVHHVHFHIIPKTTDADGLGVRWAMMPNPSKDHAAALAAKWASLIQN